MSRELKHETFADISEELRSISRSATYCEIDQPKVFGKPIAFYFTELADRIDAAELALSNMAAMREALTNLTRYGESDIRQLEQLAKRAIDNDIYGGGILQSLCEAIREGKEALSAPARQCDVGTPEQQKARHDAYCFLDVCCNYSCRECFAKWAQMPYAEEGGAE